MLPFPPGWITARFAETPEAAAFRSGAALAAAEACGGFAGWRETTRALRDAAHLTKVGDDPGPAGKLLRQRSQAVARPISVAGLGRALGGVASEQIALSLDAVGATPVDRAAQVIETVLMGNPRAETAALILADAVLSQSLGRTDVVPLLSLSLSSGDTRLRGDHLQLACHRAVVAGARQAVPLAAELTRAAVRAVELFLTREALALAALDFMSDRAARRLCDRLVDLGDACELTGRDSFRHYGL